MRAIAVGGLLLGLGVVAAGFVRDRRADDEVPAAARAPAPGRQPPRAGDGATADRRRDLEARIERLAASVAAETAARQRLEEQIAALAAQLAALGRGADGAAAAPAGAPANGDAAAGDATGAAAPVPEPGLSAMERALVAAGIDPPTAADIKRRRDELTMREMYLRDQATREQWLDSPRFAEAMAAIEAEQLSMREEIGDELYDRYLFAQGQTNRVRVDDVFSDSPAALAGLQEGDLILRYGDTRLFAPDELVRATRTGALGEPIRLEVSRGGERFEVEVPRGPLGLRVMATQDQPVS